MIEQEFSTIQMRIPTAKKVAAEGVFEELGLSLNDGIRMYVNQVARDRALPFVPNIRADIPNAETLRAIGEDKAMTTGLRATREDFHKMLDSEDGF